MRKSIFILLLIIFSIFLHAQSENSETTPESEEPETYNEARFSLQTGNNIVQAGQSMTTNEFYLRPRINFYHKTGLYVGGSLTFMPRDTSKKLDNFSLSAGYDKELSENFMIGIDYTFSQYYTTKQVASSAAHMISPYITWDNKILTPTLTPMFLLGTTNDIALQLDLTHMFTIKSIFTEDDKITIPLSVGAVGGTSDYYTTNQVRNRKVRIFTITNTKSQLAITSIYAMATVKYKIKKIAFSFNTSYYHNTDPNNTGVTNNTPVYRFTAAYYL